MHVDKDKREYIGDLEVYINTTLQCIVTSIVHLTVKPTYCDIDIATIILHAEPRIRKWKPSMTIDGFKCGKRHCKHQLIINDDEDDPDSKSE